MTKYILATFLALATLIGPTALQSQAHHCHGGWNGYRGGNPTFIDRLLGNGGGYGGISRYMNGGGYGGYGGYGGGYYPGNRYFGGGGGHCHGWGNGWGGGHHHRHWD